jgi:mRNA interferase RelE/StbE
MYQIVIDDDSQGESRKIPPQIRKKIFDDIEALADNPRPNQVLKLKGKIRHQDYYRIRVGKYRVMYRIDDANQIVYIDAIRLRADAYKKR